VRSGAAVWTESQSEREEMGFSVSSEGEGVGHWR